MTPIRAGLARIATSTLIATLALIALFAMAPAWAGGTGGDTGDVGFQEITPETRQAINRGLAYLAKIQAADGGFPSAPRYTKHVGISSLACLAFMADGNLPGRGKYGGEIQRGLDFVLTHAQETGLLMADGGSGTMYGHGFAALFLGEIYGMSPDPRVREALVKSIRLIVDSQNSEGGWRYQPISLDADISVTICQIMALRAARNAGISVPKETIEAAIDYVKACQDPNDGGFRYTTRSNGSAFPRTAAGVASLYYAGVYQDDALKRGLEYLARTRKMPQGRHVSHYFYGHYYAVQAMFLAGGEYWADWYPSIRDELIQKQQDDGSWTSGHGSAYATAMALLVLQVPNRHLPIFQR